MRWLAEHRFAAQPREASADVREPGRPAIRDMTSDSDTVALLDAADLHRERIVDELTLLTAGIYRHRRSLQCRPLDDVLQQTGALAHGGLVRLLLPLPLMPKVPLLDVDIQPSDERMRASSRALRPPRCRRSSSASRPTSRTPHPQPTSSGC